MPRARLLLGIHLRQRGREREMEGEWKDIV